MSAKKKNDFDKLNKIEKKYRLYSDIYNKYLSKINNESLSDKDLFLASIKLELAFSLRNLAFSQLFLGLNELKPIFQRRFIEALALYSYYENGLLEDVNLHIFKLKAKNREVGEKERAKIKKAILFCKKGDIAKAICENKFLYLHGTTDQVFKFSNLIKDIKLENLNKFDDHDFYFFYSLFSIFIHHPIVYRDFYKRFPNLNGLDIGNYIFKEDIKEITRLNTPSVDYKIDEYGPLFDSLHDVESELLKLDINLLKNEESFLSHSFISLFNSFFLNFAYSLVFENYEEMIVPLRSFLEKISIFYRLFSFDKAKAYKIYDLYYEGIIYSSVNYDYQISNNETLHEEELKEVYKIYKNEFKEKDNYYDFKEKIVKNPSYLIFLKKYTYSNQVKTFLNNFMKEDANELFKLYQASVDLNHASGFLGFKNNNEYKKATNVIFKLISKILNSYQQFLNKINDFSLENSEYSKEIEFIIEDLNDSFEEFGFHFKDIYGGNNEKFDLDIDIKNILDFFED